MITPVDIETKEFKKSKIGGYAIDEVDNFLDEVIYEYEKLFKENAKLRDRVNNLVETVRYFRNMEDTIRNSIISAEKNAEETKKLAETEAKNIIRNAEERAESIIQNIKTEESIIKGNIAALNAQYEGAKNSLRSLLETQLKMMNAVIQSNEDSSVHSEDE